jgi:hypothetical protein
LEGTIDQLSEVCRCSHCWRRRRTAFRLKNDLANEPRECRDRTDTYFRGESAFADEELELRDNSCLGSWTLQVKKMSQRMK